MRVSTTLARLALALLLCFGLTACDDNPVLDEDGPDANATQPITVSGSGVHYFTTAVIHSQEETETGMIQRSTDIVQLSGDIEGYVLYHPTSVFDFAAGTLVNTGTQMFSGTIGDSGPVLLHDDTFRFESDLATGATVGEVHFRRSKDAPNPGGWFECDLALVGTGLTPAGDGMVDYTGECRARGNIQNAD